MTLRLRKKMGELLSTLPMKLCQLFAVPPFTLFGKKWYPSTLIKPCAYYQDLKLTPEEISAGAKGAATVIFLAIATISHIWGLGPILYLSVALLVSYIFHGMLIRSLPLRYAHERLMIEQYADLIVNTLTLALLAGTTFDALYFVAKSQFPVVSQDFEQILYQVNNNQSPEKLLLDYAHKQPSHTLQKHITTLFTVNDVESAINLLKNSTQREVRNAYDQFTLELDSRMALAIGCATFLPIFFSLFLIVYGLATSPFMLLIVPLHITLLHFLKKRLLTDTVELIG